MELNLSYPKSENNISLKQKIQHFNLDLYYPVHIGLERETNNIITKEINSFILSYGSKFKTHTFVFDYMDDFVSVVTYYFLAAIKGISDFKFKIYSKAKETRNYLPKDVEFIRVKEIKKLQKEDKTIFISTLNLTEQVVNKKLNYSDFIVPFGKLLPCHFTTAATFYGIKMPSNFDSAATELNDWSKMKTKKIYKKFDLEYNRDRIYLVYLSDDLEKNQEILQEAQDQDCLLYYYWDGDNPNILRQVKEFSYFVKKKSNIFGYANEVKKGYNPVEIAKELGVKLIVNGGEVE